MVAFAEREKKTAACYSAILPPIGKMVFSSFAWVSWKRISIHIRAAAMLTTSLPHVTLKKAA
jgi:hypothetical protein